MIAEMIVERLTELETMHLLAGSHNADADKYCAMEMVAYLAGEPHSDKPACTCPVIAAFMRQWNDALPTDAERGRLLKPLLPALVGTRATPEVELARSWLAVDWQARESAPAWLRLAGLTAHADTLAALPPILDERSAQAAMAQAAMDAARKDAAAARAAAWAGASAGASAAAWADAWVAAGAAARAAARAAAGAAARDAEWDAAGAAARAAARAPARAAEWDAGGDAARDAAAARAAAGADAGADAWAAARAAARAALAPTVAALQLSAQALVRRMCEAQ